MKRYRMFALFIIGLATAGLTAAQGPGSNTAAPKVVAIAFNAAVLRTSEAQRELGALQAKFSPRQAQLQKLNEEVEGLRKQLTDGAGKATEQERVAREQSLNSKEKQLQREGEDFKNDSDTASQQVFQEVAQKVYSFVQAYAQEHGYSLVIERGSDANPVVWYAAADLDITDRIIKAYNAKSSSLSPRAPTSNHDRGPEPTATPLPTSPSPR